MRRTPVLVLLVVSGCGIFSDADDVVLRDVSTPDLDMARVEDQSSPVDHGTDSGGQTVDLGVDVVPLDTCGDGALQADEACDPELPMQSAGACPTSCDDGVACTLDALVGSAAACDAACTATAIQVCEHNDGCCPSGCAPNDDNDCDFGSVCGDGEVTGVESCDPGAAMGDAARCAASADECPDMVCNKPRLLGAPQNCDAVCAYVPITMCVSGDACCPMGCDESNDTDCASMCGNDLIEPGETCDGNCPANCDDGDVCTTDARTGDASTCDASCESSAITECVDDGCCPSGCSSANDVDCSSSCGNGFVEAGETCDPPGSCVTSCDDGNDCTLDAMTGSPSNCNVSCSHPMITACRVIPDGCCPTGCTANNDFDCASTCGNNVVESGETCDGNCPASCDDGNACTTDVTTGTVAACTRACSNTTINACIHADGCCPTGCNAINDNDCGAVCGNAITEPGEQCDGTCPASCNDGNACTVDIRSGNTAQCNLTCNYSAVTSCVSADGCCPASCNANNDSDCSPTCGNNIQEGGETCDGNCPTQVGCQSMSLCKTLSGSPTTCNAVCSDIPGCETCSLEGQCGCAADQTCDGICRNGDGMRCDRACNPGAYCQAWFGANFNCDLQGGACKQCNATCEPHQVCINTDCIEVANCGLSPNPSAWCVARGLGTVCVADKCQ